MSWWPWRQATVTVRLSAVTVRELDALEDAAQAKEWSEVFNVLEREGSDALLEGSPDHEPLLVLALLQNEEAVALRLLELGANPNAQRLDGRPVLVLAIERCAEEVVQALLAKGANPNTTTPSGTPALAVALRRQKSEVLLTLKKAGAQVDDAVRRACFPYLARCSAPSLRMATAIGLCSPGRSVSVAFRG